MGDHQITIYEFDDFRLDTQSLTLWHSDELIPLPPKAAELLTVMVKRPDVIISKNDLLDSVWGETFVEESNLSHNIYLLRKVFKQFGKDYIKTIPRRGYSFNATVNGLVEREEITIERSYYTQTVIEEVVDKKEDETAIEVSVINVTPPDPKPSRAIFAQKQLFAFAGIAVIAFLAVGSFLWANLPTRTNPAIAELRTLAVIPFDSHGVEDETIPIRITDALITGLKANEHFTLRPASAVYAYVRSDRDPLDIGKDLLVDAIIDGRIQHENGRLRVNLQLISVKNGNTLWSSQVDGDADRLLALQDDITAKLFSDIGLPTPLPEQLRRKGPHTTNTQAYEEYLKGRYFFGYRNHRDLLLAEKHFERSIELDPTFAGPKVGLANILAFRQFDKKEAAALAREAIKLAPEWAEPYATLAFIMSFHEWNWKASEAEFLKAVYIDPRDSLVRQWYANNLMLQGRYVEAEAQFIRALELDPTSPAILTDLGQLYFFQKRYNQSTESLKAAITLHKDSQNAKSFLETIKALNYADEIKQGSSPEMTADISKFIQTIDAGYVPINQLNKNDEIYGSRLTQQLKYYAWHNRADEAFEIMKLMAEMNHFMLPIIIHEPILDFMRDDPRMAHYRKVVNFE